MARQARLVVPGHPHHILVRGNNWQPIFTDDDDRRLLLKQLGEAIREHSLALHAYVLMPNHLHLLVTPATADALARAVQSLGRRYVAAFNLRHGRSGTLWEGRYRAHAVGGAAHVLACMRFIELNPQRAGVAAGLDDYKWSSLSHHLGGARDSLVTEPPAYWAMGNTPFEREAAYRSWIEQGVAPAELQRFVAALVAGRPVGDGAYIRELEKTTGRSLAPARRGRPRKPSVDEPAKSVPI